MTIIDALAYFKRKIKGLEKQIKEEPSEVAKMQLESIVVWNLERGLEMIKFAKPGECPQKVIDYFLDPTAKERPDVTRLKKLLSEKEEKENWLQKILRQ